MSGEDEEEVNNDGRNGGSDAMVWEVKVEISEARGWLAKVQRRSAMIGEMVKVTLELKKTRMGQRRCLREMINKVTLLLG